MTGEIPDTTKALRRSNLFASVLFVFGLSSMTGYVLDIDALRGIGSASLIAPAPKVFSDVDGLETFASSFELRAPLYDVQISLTPELYSRMHGPYLRRNVYGAALSYAPRLPEELWHPVFCYAFSGRLQQELGIPTYPYSVEIRTNTRGRSDRWSLEVPCS